MIVSSVSLSYSFFSLGTVVLGNYNSGSFFSGCYDAHYSIYFILFESIVFGSGECVWG